MSEIKYYYNLDRFTEMQQYYYKVAYNELSNGQKRTHWMWYIFPQIDGLGHSEIAKKYAIKTAEEAKAYLHDPLLGKNIREISALLLNDNISSDVSKVFGYPDDLKLCSSMTLFLEVSGEETFKKVLDKFFDGKEDERTIKLLKGKK